MKKITCTMIVTLTTLFTFANAQVGVNTATPQASLDVVGKPTNTASLDGIIPPRITGDQLRAKTYTEAQTGASVYVTAADSAPAGQTINVKSIGNYYFDGKIWKYTAGVDNPLPNGTGTVIMINGVLQVAQEMSLRLGNDWVFNTGTGNPGGANATNRYPVGQMTVELIDNYNTFTGTTTTNSFKVQQDGTYTASMNFPIQNPNSDSLSGNLYYGIYSVTDNTWVTFGLKTMKNLNVGEVENISYLVAVDLSASKTYAFYVGQQLGVGSTTPTLSMRGLSTNNGNTSLAYFSVKRLK